MNRYHASNVIIALHTAIEARSKLEKEEWGYTGDSALVAGWKDMYEALRRNERVSIRLEGE